MTKTLILDKDQIDQKINRIAYEIYENNYEEKEITIAGIVSNGFLFAKRLKKAIEKVSNLKVNLVEITMDKDEPLKCGVKVSVDVNSLKNKVVIVADDVLNSGKTLIYGVEAFLAQPLKKLQIVVLVDRNHNRYPVKADYIGLSMATTLQEHITVTFDSRNEEAVYLE